MDEPDEVSRDEEPAPPKMSKTSSWVMLGFVIGAATVWAYLGQTEKAASTPPVTLKAWPQAPRAEPSSLTVIEALFARYGDDAVWDKNTTEVAMWTAATREFSEFYEVRRVGGELYFRSIPKLTRMPIRHGKPPADDVPLRFTESEDQYREWLEHGRFERAEESLQPTLLGPALIPAGEMPKPQTPKQTPVMPPAPELEKPKVDIPPKP
jgi:hypothetical protein